MDLSQYAELFLAESREHLSACNQLLLEWERRPSSPEPVSGIFRAVHTVKGMAATMGYGRIADLSHRLENLLDQVRRGGKTPSQEIIQLLFRAIDALEKAVELAVTGREREADLTVLDAIDQAAVQSRPAAQPSALARHLPPEPAEAPTPAAAPVSSGRTRLVQVMIRPEAPLKGGRAMLVVKKAERIGTIQRIQPPMAAFESDDFDGRLELELETTADPADLEKAIRGVGDVERVVVGASTADESLVTTGEIPVTGPAGPVIGAGGPRHPPHRVISGCVQY